MRFMLGAQENDAKLNGPIILAQSLEYWRRPINEIRASLNLGDLHPDYKIHMSFCRLTGRNAEGARDDQCLRNMVEQKWPKLLSGFPEVLEELPIQWLQDSVSSGSR